MMCEQMVLGTDPSSILDIGCGDGTMSLPIVGPESRLTLLDFSPEMLERARRNIPDDMSSRVDIVCSDLAQFAPHQRFSLVLCLGVLAHVPDVGEALGKIASLIRPGGHCLVQITDAGRWLGRVNHAWFDRRSRGAEGYALNRLDSAELAEQARGVGLQRVASRSYSLAFPGMRRLPARVQFSLERRFLSSRLARHGGETLLLFKRS